MGVCRLRNPLLRFCGFWPSCRADGFATLTTLQLQEAIPLGYFKGFCEIAAAESIVLSLVVLTSYTMYPPAKGVRLKGFAKNGQRWLKVTQAREHKNDWDEKEWSNSSWLTSFLAHWTMAVLPAELIGQKGSWNCWGSGCCFAQNSPSLLQNSVSSVFRNSTVKTVFRSFTSVWVETMFEACKNECFWWCLRTCPPLKHSSPPTNQKTTLPILLTIRNL